MTRVRNAQQLLLYTDMKIADITAHCGFTSFFPVQPRVQ